MALMNVWCEGLDRSGYVFQVGLVVFVEWSGYADNDRIHLGDLRVITGSAEARLLRLLNGGWKECAQCKSRPR